MKTKHVQTSSWKTLAAGALAAAALVTLALVVKSLVDFTRTGPAIRQEIETHFQAYAVYAVGRLMIWALVINGWLALFGTAAYGAICILRRHEPTFRRAFLAGGLAIGVGTAFVFLDHLLYRPGLIVASWLYRVSRLDPVWSLLTPERVAALGWAIAAMVAVPVLLAAGSRFAGRERRAALRPVLATALLGVPLLVSDGFPHGGGGQLAGAATDGPLNVLMIGSDTLRADRLGSLGYPRPTTPFIDRLAEHGFLFSHCYVPIARTAPSIVSIMTGTWPQTHGVRANFTLPRRFNDRLPTLARILRAHGYRTEAVTDWAGADLGKYPLGFDSYQGPEDQWNIKYLIRQGPKDLRLFLSLFLHNDLGRLLLPEIYYTGGIPMGAEIERQARRRLRALARGDGPFFLTVFASTTHAPFASEYPYYGMFSDPSYEGESRYAMTGLVRIQDIIRKQGLDAGHFDIRQIHDLYDGAVRNFDAVVESLVDELEKLRIRDRTIIVIFSDHGVELFENGTWGQGNAVVGRDPSARVPLLIVDPRLEGGRTLDATVRTIDLFPTLIDLLNLPVPEEVQGTSLAPLLLQGRGDPGLTAFHETGVWLTGHPKEQERHLRYPSLLEILEIPDKRSGTIAIRPEYEDLVIEARDRMLRTDRWKLIYLPLKDGAAYWLFDLATDPDATQNVAAEHPAVLNELRDRLIRWMLLDEERTWRNEHLVPKDTGGP